MSYASRVYRHRNAHTHEQENNNGQPAFFKRAEKQSPPGRAQTPFFQAKLSVNQPGDAWEQEADSVAAAVVDHRGGAPVVQQKKITGIQRLATSETDESASTDEERMKRDKDIQTKPNIQCMCPDCAKEEKEGVQKMSDPGNEKEKLEDDKPVQTKRDGGQSASPQLSARISQSAGKGSALPRNTLAEMQSAFGTDFSHVRIHTDAEAAHMNKQLNAQAFTHGSDIYFNEGKFNPDSSSGKQLLAHELTHVLQQQGPPKERGAAGGIQRSPGAVIAVGAALMAAVSCAYAFYDYALNNYSHKGDKWMHCWVSCKITTWCGGSPTLSILMGAGKEAIDAAMDALGHGFGAEFADFVADMHGTISCIFSTCTSCCDDYYP